MDNDKTRAQGRSHGFTLLASEPISEIDGEAHVFRHDASGARLLYLANDDNNKGFSITFKTPASNDTGVFHILEHSVLCGSRKFPVKEPFVNLLKSSMQTFLNAMTFPDKTMYPVASTNERDLMNLADVYMDAVFHPNIYCGPRIFEQEGWHYELDPDDDDALVYNGVVFNEMKGALSDPESVLYGTLSAALFPDTTYRFESGGTPEGIPTLTYEKFLEQHTLHYHPANSYIILYGNLDFDSFAAFLDEKYLTPLSEEFKANAQPNPLEMQAPVVSGNVRREMPTAPENSCAALGFVAGRASERERLVAVSVLLDAIMGSNEAPLKRALLDAGIADDCDGFLADSMLQPFVGITARGLHGDDASERLRDVVRETASSLASGALDMAVVEAALSHAEFVMREGNFGYADGVMLSMASMNGWLYDDTPQAATAYIRYEDVFASLRSRLDTSYFTDLLRQIFLENDHCAQAEVVPVDADAEREERARLARVKAQMTPRQIDAVRENIQALREAQTAPDSPEDLAKLPKLSIEDIGPAPEEPGFDVEEQGALTVLRHRVETHGIVYACKYFDISSLSMEELPYVAILVLALGKLDTASHTASQLDTLVQSRLGSFNFAADIYEKEDDPNDLTARFLVSTSALSPNVEYAATMANEVMKTTNFGDTAKIYDMLVQRKVAMEQNFAMSGNSVATARAASYLLPASALRQRLGGIDFYVFLKDLIANFETRAQPLSDKLAELCGRIFIDDGCVLSFGGTDEDYHRYIAAGAELGTSRELPARRLEVPVLEDRREALVVPTDVSYTALVADRRSLERPASVYSGAWMVASRILSFDYLWNEVRVVGGAYGVSFTTKRTGPSAFSSFRDPHVIETLERFRGCAEWLAGFDPSPDEFTGYVVSTAASFDKPLKPRGLIRRQAGMFLADYSKEEYLRYRSQVIDASLDDVKMLAEPIAELCAGGAVCTVGSRDIIEQSGIDAQIVDLLAL